MALFCNDNESSGAKDSPASTGLSPGATGTRTEGKRKAFHSFLSLATLIRTFLAAQASGLISTAREMPLHVRNEVICYMNSWALSILANLVCPLSFPREVRVGHPQTQKHQKIFPIPRICAMQFMCVYRAEHSYSKYARKCFFRLLCLYQDVCFTALYTPHFHADL